MLNQHTETTSMSLYDAVGPVPIRGFTFPPLWITQSMTSGCVLEEPTQRSWPTIGLTGHAPPRIRMRRPTAEVAALAAILASQALPPQSLGVPGLLQRDRPNCAIPSAQRLFAALQFD